MSWRTYQLSCSRISDTSNGGLVILDDKRSRHVMWLIHDAKDDLLVVGEAASELVPEVLELCC